MHPRAILALLHDVSAVAVAWLAAYWLRFNLDIPVDYLAQAVAMLPWVLPVNLATFWLAGLYRGIWRYASLHDLRRILLSVAAAALLVVAGMYVAQKTAVPRSVLILYPLLLVGLMGGSRLLYRAWKEHSLYGGMHLGQKPVLVIGAGDAAADLLRELARSTDWRVVGLLDDNAAKHGRQINGVRVLGAIDRVGPIATSGGAPWSSPPREASACSGPGRDAVRDSQGRARRPARPRPHRARRSRAASAAGGQDRAGDRCRRFHRVRAVPADRPFPAAPAGVRRAVRVRALQHRTGIRRTARGLRGGRREGRGAHGCGVCRIPARTWCFTPRPTSTCR
jgi:hypothetical protein